MLYHRAGGNPLFLVSLVNDLIERDVFRQTDAEWKPNVEMTTMESAVPDTIRHLVARQSRRLSLEHRHTLEAASVAGMEFSAAAVAAAFATDTAVIEQRCEQLAERQQFLRRLGVEEAKALLEQLL
jgi:predicted ATPase